MAPDGAVLILFFSGDSMKHSMLRLGVVLTLSLQLLLISGAAYPETSKEKEEVQVEIYDCAGVKRLLKPDAVSYVNGELRFVFVRGAQTGAICIGDEYVYPDENGIIVWENSFEEEVTLQIVEGLSQESHKIITTYRIRKERK